MISCKCITYGRVNFLEESIYSFINQKYDGPKELVIVNDYPKQKLIYDHPDVRIFNLDETFTTIGAKERFATQLCKGDIVAQWDDDDLALPNHLENIEKYFVEGTDLLHWNRAIFMNAPNIQAITTVGNSGIVFSKNIWNKLGGHPLENAGYDMSFVLAIKANSKNIVFACPPDDEVSWIYVWGGRGYHMSGMGTDDDTRPNVIERHSLHIEELVKRGVVPTGDIHLNPHWNHDYSKKLIEFNHGTS